MCVLCYVVIIRLVNFDFILRHNKQENIITSQWTNMNKMNIQWTMLCSEFDGNACICLLFQNDDDVGVVAFAAVFILHSGFCLFGFLAAWTISNALRRVWGSMKCVQKRGRHVQWQSIESCYLKYRFDVSARHSKTTSILFIQFWADLNTCAQPMCKMRTIILLGILIAFMRWYTIQCK